MVDGRVLPLLPLLLMTAAPTQSRVRLVYDAADTGCPARARLASAVMARLGYEAFTDDASDTVDVQLRRAGDTLTAQVVRSNAGGETGRRELTSPTTDCSELFRALELAVAIAVDPRAGLIRPTAKPTQPSVVAPVPVPVAVTAEATPPTPTFFHLGMGPTGSLGTGPTPTFGFGLVAGFRRGHFELGVGGRVELPSVLALSPGSISTQAVVGNLSACLAVSILRACALGEVGALRVTSAGLTPPAQQTAVLADLGVRIAVHLQLSQHLALRPFLDLAASLARTAVFADGKAVWTTYPVFGTLGLALLLTSGL